MKKAARSLVHDHVYLILLLLAACGGGGGGGSGSGGNPVPQFSGTVLFLSDSNQLPGSTPPAAMVSNNGFNDSVDRAQSIGPIAAGSSLRIEGELAAGFALAGFAFVAPERVEVSASIGGAGANEAELLVYDPVVLQYVARGSQGRAKFLARGACDVVVRGSESGGKFTLELTARACGEIDLGTGAEPIYLGDLSVGESIRCRGELQLPGGAPRKLVLTVPESSILHVERACELSIRDVTIAGEERDLTANSVSASSGRDATVRALSSIEIDVTSGAPGPITLSLEAREMPPPAAQPNRIGSASLAPLEQELRFDPRAKPGAYFGLPRNEFAPGLALVAPKEGADLGIDVARRGARIDDAIPGSARLVAFDLPAEMGDVQRSRATIAMTHGFAASPRVAYSELNRIRRAFGGAPNDTYYPLQWHYPLIHLPQAWNITKGSDSVIVAILDTGQTNHPDLVDRQIAGYDFISDPASAGDGDGIDPDPTDVGDGDGPHPNSWHGTHVAGTVGAETNNMSGVAGVTWFGKLMHLRVLGKKGGTDFDISNAVRYAAGLSNDSNTLPAQKANVINMSLGGPGSSQTMQSAVTAARGQGLVIFAAAGNENSSQPSFPGAYQGVISVAAVDMNANRAPYSNFGPTIAICAPGGDTSVDLDHDGHPDGVLSTLWDDSTNPKTPIYAFYDGTSMATPHASGVAALMLAVNPMLTPDQIEAMMESTATDLGAPGRDDYYGFGLIDAYAAVVAASGASGPNNPLLFLAVPSLSFGNHDTDLSVGVANIGTGMLDVTGVAVTMDTGTNWLSATTAGPSNAATNVSVVNVHVDRSHLADAVYAGSVQVNSSNGGEQTVVISMVVQSAAPPVNVNLFVLAVDATTLQTKGQSMVNPTTGLGWAMFDLPQGSYILVCGSDDDHNETICDQGDTYCGLYPTIDSPQAVQLGSTPIGSLDFSVSAVGTTALDASTVLDVIRKHGLRLLR
jgi:subtilisin family serine protease